MNNLKTITNGIIILFLLVATGCKDDLIPKPLKTGKAPGMIENYSYSSIPGGAVITYDLPQGEDLRYVKATYKLNSGLVREAKSTIYKNTLLVDGFADEGEYDITLTAVGVGDVESPPTNVKIKALRPYHKLVIDSVQINNGMYAAFGGLNVDFSNFSGSPLIFHILAKNDGNKWEEIQTVYSGSKTGRLRTRGLDAVEKEFAVYVTDRWNNRSDTISASLLPLKEALISTPIKSLVLAGDTWDYHRPQGRARGLDVLFDGVHGTNGIIFQSKTSDVMPQWFTFDMTQEFILSRFIVYPDYTADNRYIFAGGHPLDFELWGSNNPTPDFDSWTKVGVFKSVKPSGGPVGVVTIEDVDQAKNGEEFEVEGNSGSFRYWRFKTISTWGSVVYIAMSELTFYGAL